MDRKEKKTTVVNRERILNTAARLIKEKGVSRISLADIAEAAKISKGTLYYYYPSKGELIFDITEQSMNQMTQKILGWVERSREATSAADILKIVFDTILKARSRGQIHLYLILEALTDEALRRRFCDEYEKWLAMIQSGLNRILPKSRGRDTALLAQIILAAIYGLLLQSLLGAPRPPLEDISRFFVSR
ncbi:MAG: TetR/AcrR family transcriptional regulator [Spirochaetales bacterium]|jgi:AcrR family transcriptional regulator|nr:TetR/AcrR family transcriptional regulator [Spirochaetales bacterium]